MDKSIKTTILLYRVSKDRLTEVKNFLKEKNGRRPSTYDDAVNYLYEIWEKQEVTR